LESKFGLEGKTAVVTGASSGIGRQIALQLARDGANLALLARRQEKLDILSREIGELDVSVRAYPCDVSSLEQVQEAFETIVADFENIDCLVNNAGFSTKAPIESLANAVAAFDNDYAVNTRGTFLCTLAAYPMMSRGGAIVNISSIRAQTGTPSASIGYAAAKAGVINLTKSFAQHLAKHKIRVNCVAPGAIYPTGISEHWSLQEREEIAVSCLLRRLGTPQDIANAVCFLLSDLASFITGHVLDVNGGR
jgi:3-oxoacyl-[acyl-carrier protein] reductase